MSSALEYNLKNTSKKYDIDVPADERFSNIRKKKEQNSSALFTQSNECKLMAFGISAPPIHQARQDRVLSPSEWQQIRQMTTSYNVIQEEGVDIGNSSCKLVVGCVPGMDAGISSSFS